MGTELRWIEEPTAAGIRVRMEHSYRNPSFTLDFVAPILLYHGRDHEKDISWTTPNEPFLVPHFGAQFCARRTHEIPRKGSSQISSISWIMRQKVQSRRDDVLFMWISSLGLPDLWELQLMPKGGHIQAIFLHGVRNTYYNTEYTFEVLKSWPEFGSKNQWWDDPKFGLDFTVARLNHLKYILLIHSLKQCRYS